MDEGDKPFKCCYCGKDFALCSYRTKHIKRIHNKTSNGKDIVLKTSFICELCEKEFSYKSSLQRHRSVVHFTNEIFSCNVCNYKTVRKDDLKKHVPTVHSNTKRVKNFKCAHCKSAFTYRNNLRRHEKIKHKIQRIVRTMINRKCPLCKFSSSGSRKTEINDHFKNTHNLKMEWQKLNFQNKKDFNNWKNKIEIKNNISFIKGKFSPIHSLHYICHRSGKFKSSGTNKRHLKIAGSCKINSHCPCEIVAKPKEDGRIFVYYLPTHVGHMNELKFLRLRPEDRRNLAAKLLSKSPHEEILKDIRMSVSNNELKRIHLLNNKDLINIEKSFNIDKEAEKHPYNPVSIEAWVQELTASKDTAQVIYKPQGKYDPQWPNLKQEDFVLIYMTKAQKSMLQRFGNDIICITGTHGVNNHNFQLYTLLTIDESREGFPCAFMFSNRGDIPNLSIFYQAIKDEVGQISPSVFMSDLEDTFYSAWTIIMGPANLRLFCTWHVLKAWRSNLHKIKNKQKKEEVYKILKTIMYELDPLTFHELLTAALKRLYDDSETQEYCKYFLEQYVKGDIFKNWAYCYRLHAKINTNMSLVNFNRVLKYCYLKGKKVQCLDKTLCAILNLVRDKLFDYIIKIERGKLVSKLQILRRRHKTAITTYTDKDVVPDGDNKWNVVSSTDHDVYTVTKIKDCKICQLQCLHCMSCIHEYICTCMDNSIKNNMCKHVHTVARALKNTQIMTPLPNDNTTLIKPPDNELKEIILTQISNNSINKLEEKKENINDLYKMTMEEAMTEEQVDFVNTKIKPMFQVVKALTTTSQRQLLVPDAPMVPQKLKIEQQRRFSSTKKSYKHSSSKQTLSETERLQILVDLLNPSVPSDDGEQH